VPPAVELREAAAAKFKEAHDLVDGKDELSAEEEQKFQSLMAEAKDADAAYMKAAGREGELTEMKERLSFYHESATGKPVDWSKIGDVKSGGPGNLPHYAGGLIVPEHAKSLGETFILSDEYKGLKESGALSDGSKVPFRTNPVELKAATDIISSSSAAAGDRLGPSAALNVAQFLPTTLGLPQRPLTVRDLFSQATTSADLISYARQSAFDNAAAAVAQAAVDGTPSGAKPQSSIAFTRTTTPVETIATWMAATRQQLADAGQLRSLIDNQGRLMIQLEEEDQLINGDGTAPNISGLLDHTLQTLDLTAASGTRANLDGLRTAKRLVRTGTARATADGVVMHPVDSEEFDLMVDDQGRYRAGDPFGVLGPSSDAPPIWRMRRVESEAVTEGTAIVGAFKQGATVFERNGIQVFTSDSHSDFFIKNLVAILFEERLALAVFFPTAFVEVTLKDWDAAS
jgi:HK97 family phage major capsid protein